MELPLPLFCWLLGLNLVLTGLEQVMNPSPASSKILVNTKFVKISEIVIEAFLGEPEMTFLKVSLVPSSLGR